MSIELDEFVHQPIEGLLYDLNILPEVIYHQLNKSDLSCEEQLYAANTYACMLVIKRLKEIIDKKELT